MGERRAVKEERTSGDSTLRRMGKTSRTISKFSLDTEQQQLAAAVTAVRWTLVEKKSKY
ncbi:hypothetical protein BY996DRAFT_6511737 [Phakopsora pachyrhizi]|nr:hypothetical protein BY996DRAFT_6555421 [Phakopsora pachyrhizi]KAI8443509.1 hypothetical protein BY996DRAFT_6511737 [Phakopsora pachyrhizi]